MARSVGDPVGDSADTVVFRYCRRCDRQAVSCPHEGNRFEVGLHGGTVNARVLQLAVDDRWVRWVEYGAYLKLPHSALLRAFGTRTSKVEVLDTDNSWWLLAMPTGSADVETWDDGRVRSAAIPRHALTPYAPREVNGKRRMAKVRSTLATRPCYCHQATCPDRGDRRARWAHEHGGEDADVLAQRAEWP